MTHILLSLPSPQLDMFKKCIWGNKIHKFRREIMETLPCLGGFKLTNLRVFDTALKLSWLKRLLTQSKGWAEFPIKFRILDILKYGDNFPQKIRI